MVSNSKRILRYDSLELMDMCYRSEKKLLQRVNESMKKKHQLRLIELEESVLLAQVNI